MFEVDITELPAFEFVVRRAVKRALLDICSRDRGGLIQWLMKADDLLQSGELIDLLF